MTNLQKGLLLAGVQLALVASLAAKYAIDRARLPRVWAQTVAYDPSLPIRGRYVSFRLMVTADGVSSDRQYFENVTLTARDGHLVVEAADHPTGLHVNRWRANTGGETTALMEPVVFFLPEHAVDPSRRVAGEELWVEVSVPKSGAPRPVQLAVKRGDIFTPLNIR